MAVTFTGSSYLSTTNVPAGQTLIASPFTVAIWVYPTTSGGTVIDGGDSGIYLAIVSSRTSGAQFLDSAAVMNSLSVGSWYLDLQQSSFGEEQYVEGANTHTNQWVHIAASYSGSGAATKVYQNGVLQTPLSSGGGLIASEAWNRIIVGGFKGDAQDAWIFNRVLTDSEVAQLYADRNAPINTSGLVAYYPLANGAGSVVDFSGNGRNLTATGTVVDASRNAPTSWRGRSPNIILPASSGVTSISGSGGNASAGSGSLLPNFSAAGNVSSAAAGTLSSSAAIAASGGVASAASMDAYQPGGMPSRFQGSAQYTRSVSLAGSQVHTLMAWARSDASNPDNTVVHLDNGTDTDSSRIGLVLNGATPSSVFVQHRTSAGSTAVLPATSFNAWHHLALVIDGTNQVSYIDGTQVDSRAFNASLRTTAFTIIRIGDQFTANTEDCSIQDVQIYTAGLSAEEINLAMRGTVPPAQASNLYAHWMVQRNDPLKDISGNGRGLSVTGTVTGSSFAPLYGPATGSVSAGSGTLSSGGTAISASGAVSSAASVVAQTLASAASNVASAASGALLRLISAAGATQSAAGVSAQYLVSATGAVQSSGSAAAQSLITAAGAVQSAGSGTAGEQVALAGTGDIHSAAGSIAPLQLVSADGAVQSAASATIAVTTPISASGGVQSDAAATAQQLVSGAGNVQSAASGTLAAAAALVASGAVRSAGAASVGGGIAGDGDIASAGTVTAQQLTAAVGGVQSAASGAVLQLVASTGAIASAASAAAQSLAAASGNDNSAGNGNVVQLFGATGGIASAASGTMSTTFLMTGTGGISGAGFGTMSGGTPAAGGGDGKQTGTARRWLAATGSRRRMRR